MGSIGAGDSIQLDADLKLDVIDVSEGDPDYLPYATHRFAFDTRTPVEITVRPNTGGTPVSVTVDVARGLRLLVAVKLGISEGVGRQRDTRKVGSDAFDVVRLLQRFGPDVCSPTTSPSSQRRGSSTGSACSAERHLINNADRTAAAIVRSSIPGVQTIAADQLELPRPRFHGAGYIRDPDLRYPMGVDRFLGNFWHMRGDPEPFGAVCAPL